MKLQVAVKDFKSSIEKKYPKASKKVPYIVRLIENPASPIALPGAINAYNHDCLHVLLKQDFLPKEEAFVIGFCMGNSSKIARIQVSIFKFFALYIYPVHYRLSKLDLTEYDKGFYYGSSRSIKDINLINFQEYHSYSVYRMRIILDLNDIDESL